MTREETITALGDTDRLLWGMSTEDKKYYSEAFAMAISALSAEGEYIKKEDIIKECISYADHENNVKFKKEVSERRKHDSEVIIYACEHFRKFVNGLQSYSFPDREIKNGKRFSCPNCGFKADWYIPDREKGEWIADVDKWGDVVTTVNGYTCSKCGAFNSDKDNFCPNCGADMRGET